MLAFVVPMRSTLITFFRLLCSGNFANPLTKQGWLGRCRFWGRAAAVLFLTGCSGVCSDKVSHSCPEPGHGPCYLCDEGKGVVYGKKDVIWRRNSR